MDESKGHPAIALEVDVGFHLLFFSSLCSTMLLHGGGTDRLLDWGTNTFFERSYILLSLVYKK